MPEEPWRLWTGFGRNWLYGDPVRASAGLADQAAGAWLGAGGGGWVTYTGTSWVGVRRPVGVLIRRAAGPRLAGGGGGCARGIGGRGGWEVRENEEDGV